MGGASSKASRRLPSKPSTSWAGARTDRAGPSQPQRPSPAAASETKDKAIEMDAGDPHFMRKLNQLGPVKVDHHMSTFRTDAHVKHVLHSRDVSEQQATSHAATRNRILASELFDLLEHKKSTASLNELIKLANRYDMDVDVLERLGAFANTPSIVEGSRQKVLEEDGRERFTTLVRPLLVSFFEPN
ncbi:hypothetical protein DFH11DRAFT_1504699 [Phellopilus nigrolimitatus]|nr:hypothetical protein DFH11DRAFT_1504699 [Phellopilus nigrolimitatus]